MLRPLACLSILLAIVSCARAQVPQPGEPVRLVLHPAALPEPSLKYPLLPPREGLAPEGDGLRLFKHVVVSELAGSELNRNRRCL